MEVVHYRTQVNLCNIEPSHIIMRRFLPTLLVGMLDLSHSRAAARSLDTDHEFKSMSVVFGGGKKS